MSATFKPVSWTRSKWVYDAVVVALIAVYLIAFMTIGEAARGITQPLDGPTLAMKALGSCAFLLLTLVLAIGPLARLDRRFLPLLYNRRHLGVLTCSVAVAHALEVLGWYFAFSPTPPLVGVLAMDTEVSGLSALPFLPFGIAALLILLVLAATSHDFWLSFLTPPMWKAIHMSVYAAYGFVVVHVAFGQLQSASSPLLSVLVGASAALLVVLHLATARLSRRRDRAVAPPAAEAPWVVAGRADEIAEGRAIVVSLAEGEQVAIFRHEGRLAAISNLCAHQNGPLGEGRVLDGCVTCPWHGFQYRLEDGCAPPPFTEKVATYHLRLHDGTILLDPRPAPPGTPIEPVRLAG